MLSSIRVRRKTKRQIQAGVNSIKILLSELLRVENPR
jgi:hypothetical protein